MSLLPRPPRSVRVLATYAVRLSSVSQTSISTKPVFNDVTSAGAPNGLVRSHATVGASLPASALLPPLPVAPPLPTAPPEPASDLLLETDPHAAKPTAADRPAPKITALLPRSLIVGAGSLFVAAGDVYRAPPPQSVRSVTKRVPAPPRTRSR